jgi:hypothetical protein
METCSDITTIESFYQHLPYILKCVFPNNVPLPSNLINNLANDLDIKWYNKLKHLQRRQHLRFILQSKSATIIQMGCESWLWKPMCRDTTPGINVKIGYDLIECVKTKKFLKYK